jgi:hypothetical protein
MPTRLQLRDMPRHHDGGLKSAIGFFTNGGPWTLGDVNLGSLYRISKEGDYTLTVCPAVYRFETNGEYLDRVDLPCVSLHSALYNTAFKGPSVRIRPVLKPDLVLCLIRRCMVAPVDASAPPLRAGGTRLGSRNRLVFQLARE